VIQSGVPTSDAVLRKVAWRLVPFLCLLYVFNILDRGNLGFARVRMQDDLGLSKAVFDQGFGIFYLGYLLFEVPANLLMRRFGARRWIARIMISWGLISSATMAVTGPATFYLVRILLGVAEAGFFPGIVLYLTFWFPARERGKMMAFFMMASPLAGVLGNPISGAIMQFLHGTAGLPGWQWLFLLEGIPSIILGFVVLAYLPDGPDSAGWLNETERDLLRAQLDEPAKPGWHISNFGPALLDGRVWLLIAIYFTVALGSNAAPAYFPTWIAEQFTGRGEFEVGLLAALPYACAVVGMTLVAAHSDRTGSRRRHLAFAASLASVGWVIRALWPTPAGTLLGWCVAQTGMMAMLPTFWTLPPTFLQGAAAAGGIALINSVANLGGWWGASVLRVLGPWSMAVALVLGATLALTVPQERGSEGPTKA
jgi:MFS transporter, ACS family, tartrate transporter